MRSLCSIIFLLFACFLVLGMCVGCGSPSDLPALAAFKITVTKAGTPAEGVVVSVHSPSLPNTYNCYGVTDSNGVVSLATYAQSGKRKKYAGAPVGEIKIGLRRSDDYGMEDPREATKGMSRDESYAYAAERNKRMAENANYVPLAVTDPLISPIEFTISNAQNELTVELNDPQWDIPVDPKRLKKR